MTRTPAAENRVRNRIKENLLGGKARLGILLVLSALAFAAIGTGTASAGIVCMVSSNTAAFFDSNSPQAQTECNGPPAQAPAPETNNLTVSRVVGDDPTQPGQQA